MLKTFQVILFCLFAQSVFAEGSSVLAVVNGDPVTDLDVAKRMKLISMTSGIPGTPQAMKVLKPQIVQMLIDEKLINQEANKIGVEADQSEIEAVMSSLAERNKLSRAQFEGLLKQKGIDRDVLTEQVKHQVLWTELISSKIRPTISVSSQEIEENEGFIRKAHKSEGEQIEQVRLAEIVIFATDKNIEKQLRFARKLSDDLRNGADFTKVAKEFSLSGSASHGGDLGWIYVEQLAPELAAPISRAGKGAVTAPIVLQDGIHIIKVQDVKKKTSSQNTEINEEQIREALFQRKLNLAIRSYLNKIRKNAYIRIND